MRMRLAVAIVLWPLLFSGQSAGAAEICPKALAEKSQSEKAKLYTQCLESGKLSKDQRAEALFQRGVALANSDQTEQAIADMNSCLEVTSRGGEVLFVRAQVYLMDVEYEKALADIEESIRLAPYPERYVVKGRILAGMEDGPESDTAFEIGIALNKKRRGFEAKVAEIHSKRAYLRMERDDLPGALDDFNAAIRIHPDAALYNGRGACHMRLGKHAEAKNDYSKALAVSPGDDTAQSGLRRVEAIVAGKEPEADHDSLYFATYVAKSKEAEKLIKNGKYVEASRKLQQAKTAMERCFDANSIASLGVLDSLIAVYMQLNDYASALPLLKQSLTILETWSGHETAETATAMDRLANRYAEIGDLEQSVALHEKALDIHKKAFEPNLMDLANNMRTLASDYMRLGNAAAAEPLLTRAYAIQSRIVGEDDPSILPLMTAMAEYHWRMGQHDKAGEYFRKALLLAESQGPDHTDVAWCLGNLGAFEAAQGNIQEAERLFRRAISIIERAKGAQDIQLAPSLAYAGMLAAIQGREAEGLELMVRGQRITDGFIDQIMAATSERQKILFLAEQNRELVDLFGLVASRMSDDPKAVKACLDVWLKRKGAVLEVQRAYQQALYKSADPQLGKLLRDMSQARTDLSNMILLGPKEGEDPAARRDKIAALETRIQDLETEVSGLSRSFSLSRTRQTARTDQVARLLPAGSALVEFVRTPLRPVVPSAGKIAHVTPDHYLAFVVHAAESDKVGLTDLGEAAPIDAAQERLKGLLADPNADHADPATAKTVADASRELHDLLFAPLRGAIGSARDISLSPDGPLNLLPFEILQGPGERFLIEDFTFVYLTSGRDLLGFGVSDAKAGKSLFLGNPDFDLNENDRQAAITRLGLTRSGTQTQAATSRDLRGVHFEPLPGTQQEIDALRAIFGMAEAEYHTGKEALEDLLRNRKSPRILHLATHGFFLPDQMSSDVADAGIGPEGRKPGDAWRGFENPLVRSGLALAGANKALAVGPGGSRDGLVTAQKVLGLDLQGTELVVLSACESGLGETRAGEGVFGLRRAFMQAGARGQIMSMWPVPDEETTQLMVSLYGQLRTDGGNPAQALRHAALQTMASVRKRLGHANPFFWGAFVFLGDCGTVKNTVVAPEAAAPTSGSTPAVAGKAVPVDLELHAFLEKFFAARASNVTEDAMRFYGDEVDFFKMGKVGRNIVRQNLKYYSDRWPVRSSTITDVSVSFNPDRQTFEVEVAYEYLTQNGNKKKNGKAKDAFGIQRTKDGYRVIAEKNVSIQRVDGSK
ncbi:CHAT domain-containing protein [Desulfolutivibrio sulfoxidireducens]|uniref:CHAT domain-containing protein n=1 Tax=Desulfolutivibrio sulfoxidireducens TaxID=2773299 RepID=UPI00159D68CF|nr:CHAT domain-containing protein [Desulfolutivibrio sulfoxidireducens]QLA18357.1 CHAT domain-containing protein [Desulfolutivibrio sulfoxidireducens]